VLRAADNPASAIENRKSSKMRYHFVACKRDGIDFQPLVVETFGGWDKDALPVNILKKIARQSARRLEFESRDWSPVGKKKRSTVKYARSRSFRFREFHHLHDPLVLGPRPLMPS